MKQKIQQLQIKIDKKPFKFDSTTKHLKIVFKEMCNRVGARLSKVDLNDPKWYATHRWTTHEQEAFQCWLMDYLYDNSQARKEIMSWPNKRKKYIKQTAEEFTFMWGWITK